MRIFLVVHDENHLTIFHIRIIRILKKGNSMKKDMDGEIKTAAKPFTLKIQNRKTVMSIFNDGLPHSIADISLRTGVSRQTITKALDHFVRSGLITSSGKGDSTETGGKKPTLFQLAAEKTLLILLLRGKEFHISLYTMNLQEIGSETLASEIVLANDFSSFMKSIRETADRLFRLRKGAEESLYGIAVVTPGIVEDNEILRYSLFNDSWGRNIPVKNYFQEAFPTAQYVFVENIGKMAGFGTIASQKHKYSSLRIVTVYTYHGISGCFFDKGNLIQGANSIIGEFGHMVIDPQSSATCKCGKTGCFESLTRNDTIQSRIQHAKDIDDFLAYMQKPLSKINFNDIVLGAEQGFQCCRTELSTLAHYFAQTFFNIATVYDPDVFILQGNFSSYNRHFIDEFYKYISEVNFLTKDQNFRLESDRCSLIELELSGAIHALKEHFFSDELIYR
jgi:predicted NBD/HSP70 family sugar kinase